MWTERTLTAAGFAFVLVFITMGLAQIASELENPFGADIHDLNAADLQSELNTNLLCLLSTAAQAAPQLTVDVHTAAQHLATYHVKRRANQYLASLHTPDQQNAPQLTTVKRPLSDHEASAS